MTCASSYTPKHLSLSGCLHDDKTAWKHVRAVLWCAPCRAACATLLAQAAVNASAGLLAGLHHLALHISTRAVAVTTHTHPFLSTRIAVVSTQLKRTE